jgi:hypothetical protein
MRWETEPGFGICVPRALEIRSRFSCWSTKMRFHEQVRWGHHGGGTKVDPGPAKAQPVYYRSIDPLSLTLLGETCSRQRLRFSYVYPPFLFVVSNLAVGGLPRPEATSVAIPMQTSFLAMRQWCLVCCLSAREDVHVPSAPPPRKRLQGQDSARETFC